MVVAEAPVVPAEAAPEAGDAFPRRRWNRDEYYRLKELEILPERGVELIEGDVIVKYEADSPRRRWTGEECRRMVEAGLLSGERLELIEGDLIVKMGQGRLHVFVVARLVQLLMAIFGAERVQAQGPISLHEVSEPEPDVVVLRETLRDYLDRQPGPADVLLAVEVSDATLRRDTTIKAAVYARAGIAEYWVANVTNRTLLVFREPGANGYVQTLTLAETDSVSPLAAPQATIAVADLLP